MRAGLPQVTAFGSITGFRFHEARAADPEHWLGSRSFPFRSACDVGSREVLDDAECHRNGRSVENRPFGNVGCTSPAPARIRGRRVPDRTAESRSETELRRGSVPVSGRVYRVQCFTFAPTARVKSRPFAIGNTLQSTMLDSSMEAHFRSSS
jgi:hypothetical protein